MTRVVNALASSEASKLTVEKAYVFMNRFYPRPKSKSIVPVPKEQPAQVDNLETMNELPRTRSTSQLDIDSKIANFAGLIQLVSSEPFYKPNEVELQVESLKVMLTGLREMQTSVVNAKIALSNGRAASNWLLYSSVGIHGTAMAIKRYMKSLFGFKGEGYQLVRGIKFLKRKVYEPVGSGEGYSG